MAEADLEIQYPAGTGGRVGQVNWGQVEFNVFPVPMHPEHVCCEL